MRVLGAILAGGASKRFGSDKAVAMSAGMPLLDHVVAAVLPQVESLVIVGRLWPGHHRVDDLPAPGFGPLGGLAGALGHALAGGFDALLCVPCDTLGLPSDLVARLSPGPSVALDQRIIGLWPSNLAPALIARLSSGESLALHAWITATGAREVDCGSLRNVNHPADLD